MSPLRSRWRLPAPLLALVSVLAAGLFSAATASASVVTHAASAPATCSSSLAAVVVVREPENRVKGLLAAGPPRTGSSTHVLPNSVRGFDLFLRLFASGVTVYVNGDPVNLSDPTGHHPAYDSNYRGEQAQEQADSGAALGYYRSANANANAAAKAGPAVRGHAAYVLDLLEAWAADAYGARIEALMARGESSLPYGAAPWGTNPSCYEDPHGVVCPAAFGDYQYSGAPTGFNKWLTDKGSTLRHRHYWRSRAWWPARRSPWRGWEQRRSVPGQARTGAPKSIWH
ncbi:MAG: hypothetical protein M3019_03010 [Candidatus Dormibacteraeota bacterium]|nr:hypothetical protein [Candidatus Dormibacteraeota bacterium]